MRFAATSLVSALIVGAQASPALADEPLPPSKVAVDPGPERSPRPPLQVAVDPGEERPSPPPPPPPPPPVPSLGRGDGAGPRLSVGRLLIPGIPDGFYGRFETEYWEVHGRQVMGITLGLEGWGTPRGGGGGAETMFYLGVRQPFLRGRRAPCFFATGGPGWDWLLIDRLYGDTGVGLLAPFVNANAGVDFRGVRLMFDARAQYRWQWGADDYAHYHLGLTLNVNSELWDGPTGDTR